MKNYRYDFEMLSAYLDGELSLKEKIYIEEKIKSSLELQRKLNELKKLREVTSESKPVLDESYYFEQRLMASLSSSKNHSDRIKKWLPAVSFSAIAVALIFVFICFKYQPSINKKFN